MKKYFKKINKFRKENGFVLLFAVLISTLVLSVGISVISIALKQIILSGTGRDSQFAFYAANTGAECAYYWDAKSDDNYVNSYIFYSSTTNSNIQFDEAKVKCLQQPLLPSGVSKVTPCTPAILSGDGWCIEDDVTQKQLITKFRIKYTGSQTYCADVIVSKQYDVSGAIIHHKITSNGYNTCDAGNPRRIERTLEFNY